MRTRDIPDREWASFFECFSRVHQHQPVTVSTLGSQLGVQSNARELPLMGVMAEALPDGARRIEIMLGESPGGHLVHTITRPSHVTAAQWNDGYSAAVRIESAEVRTTLVRVGPEAEVLEPGVVMDDVNPQPH